MQTRLPYPKGSLLFAPLEGITDRHYRKAIMDLYPEWDYFSTDFIRLPSQGHYSEKKIQEHFGRHLYSKNYLDKTAVQILATIRGDIVTSLKTIKALGHRHIDLNLGCPSKTVNSHGGGAYLLGNLNELEKILSTIRKNWQEVFTVKIRTGYRDADQFTDIISLLTNQGVDAITIHGRTRDQLYKGTADWSFFEQASKHTDVPIIANGDIWELKHVQQILNETGCYAVMCGRSALKSPWLAKIYKQRGVDVSHEELISIRRQEIISYYLGLKKSLLDSGLCEKHISKKFKSVARHLFDDLPDGEIIRSQFLRSQHMNDLMTIVMGLSEDRSISSNDNLFPN